MGKEESIRPTKLKVRVVEGRDLMGKDCLVGITFNGDVSRESKTRVMKNNANPVWDETFEYWSEDPHNDRLQLVVYGHNRLFSNEFLGRISIPIIAVCNLEKPLDEWYTLLDKKAQSKAETKKKRGELRVILIYGEKTEEKAQENELARSMKVVEKRMDSHWEIDFNELSLQKELGRGAFGIVYRGKWRLQDVAVKLLLNQQMTHKELEEFRAECQLMMRLRPHRNVVPLLGVCTDPKKQLCIVTDFVENESLEKLIRSPYVINWRLVLSISKGIAAGVFHLHCENILHRDLASRNILLRANYEPLIADFGLSKKVEIPSSKELQVQDQPNFRGPYKWMAPESLKRSEFTIKSDSFSFGVVLWEIISRQEPFPHYDIYQAAHAVSERGERLPIPPNCPSKFAQIMHGCWQTNPEDRPDFQQIAGQLNIIEKEIDRY